ncbi:hypothetical protein HYV11_03480 [Candidatus Dependentiae bacterium]|nr:hypothetical protein [Candidatus Dependentiae bacterium]
MKKNYYIFLIISIFFPRLHFSEEPIILDETSLQKPQESLEDQEERHKKELIALKDKHEQEVKKLTEILEKRKLTKLKQLLPDKNEEQIKGLSALPDTGLEANDAIQKFNLIMKNREEIRDLEQRHKTEKDNLEKKQHEKDKSKEQRQKTEKILQKDLEENFQKWQSSKENQSQQAWQLINGTKKLAEALEEENKPVTATIVRDIYEELHKMYLYNDYSEQRKEKIIDLVKKIKDPDFFPEIKKINTSAKGFNLLEFLKKLFSDILSKKSHPLKNK